MNPRRATTAVLCLTCLIATANTLHGMVWPGGGDRPLVPAPLQIGAAHAATVADLGPAEDVAGEGFWGEYQGYLANPDGHVWSGEQR